MKDGKLKGCPLIPYVSLPVHDSPEAPMSESDIALLDHIHGCIDKQTLYLTPKVYIGNGQYK